jgi:hypothetical protein
MIASRVADGMRQGYGDKKRSIAMRIDVGFPAVEIGADLAVVRDFVHTPS